MRNPLFRSNPAKHTNRPASPVCFEPLDSRALLSATPFTGTWVTTIHSPGSTIQITEKLTQKGSTITGTERAQVLGTPYYADYSVTGTVKGNAATLTSKITHEVVKPGIVFNAGTAIETLSNDQRELFTPGIVNGVHTTIEYDKII